MGVIRKRQIFHANENLSTKPSLEKAVNTRKRHNDSRRPRMTGRSEAELANLFRSQSVVEERSPVGRVCQINLMGSCSFFLPHCSRKTRKRLDVGDQEITLDWPGWNKRISCSRPACAGL